MKPDLSNEAGLFFLPVSREADLKTRRGRTQQRWTRNVTVTPRVVKRLPAKTPKIKEPARGTGNEVHLGPYESCYDVALGYGFERAIVTP
jgi:hypothetical protein